MRRASSTRSPGSTIHGWPGSSPPRSWSILSASSSSVPDGRTASSPGATQGSMSTAGSGPRQKERPIPSKGWAEMIRKVYEVWLIGLSTTSS